MKITPKNDSGFTLIEVLIATTILSILMTTVYSIINNSSTTKDRIISEDREMIQIETALNRIETDFSQIYSPLYHSPSKSMQKAFSTSPTKSSTVANSEESIYEKSERFPEENINSHPVPIIKQENKNTLMFLSSSNRRYLEDSKQSRYIWLKYSIRASTLDEEEQKAPYELVRSSQSASPYQKEFDWENVKDFVLLRNIKELSFHFWNPETKKFQASLTTLNNFAKTPRAMMIKLTWVDTNGTEKEVLKTYRPLWPNFDNLKDLKEIQLAQKQSDSDAKTTDMK